MGRPAAHLALAGLLFGNAGCQPRPEPRPQTQSGESLSQAIQAAVVGTALASDYAALGNRPLWVTPQGPTPAAYAAVETLARARADGFDPADYGAEQAAALLAAAPSDAARLARLELMLSDGVARYIHDLRTRGTAPGWTDPDLSRRATDPHALMSEAAAAPSRQAWLTDAVRMHPLYEALRAAGTHSEEEARVVRANLDRLRWLPADPGERYILVDAAAAQLTMVEHGRATGTMRVIVGKPGMATPMLAGLIRYAAYNPYWNLPPDLSAQRALRVLHDGPGVLASERLEILADWSPEAAVLDPASVDWRAMGAGQLGPRLRQLPGKRNMMGSVKFMLPNPLGIYLHDTPDKAAFQQTARRLSSGCVRVEDPARLAAWLFGKTPEPTGLAEERIDLPRPVPVYVVYLTAAPEAGKVALRPDPEGRDALT